MLSFQSVEHQRTLFGWKRNKTSVNRVQNEHTNVGKFPWIRRTSITQRRWVLWWWGAVSWLRFPKYSFCTTLKCGCLAIRHAYQTLQSITSKRMITTTFTYKGHQRIFKQLHTCDGMLGICTCRASAAIGSLKASRPLAASFTSPLHSLRATTRFWRALILLFQFVCRKFYGHCLRTASNLTQKTLAQHRQQNDE